MSEPGQRRLRPHACGFGHREAEAARCEPALSGTTVVDLTTGIDGPYCTKLLADQGAAVLKVEPPGGDPSRRVGPFPGDVEDPERSALFIYLNANKRLTATPDLDRAHALVANGALDVEALRARHPHLVIVSITPFGRTGPYADYKAPDLVRQALSGWLWQGGFPDAPPLRAGGELSQYVTGVCAAVATALALHHARATGEGQHVDVSALEALTTCAGQEGTRFHVDGPDAVFRRMGHGTLPYAILPCRDGWVGVSVLTQPHWEGLCDWIGRRDLLELIPRVETLRAATVDRRHAREATDAVAAWLAGREKVPVVEQAQARRIPFALVPEMHDLLELPQFTARGFIVEADHPLTGRHRQPGAPFRMSRSPWVGVS